jgi:hypothetical protein
MSETTVQEPIPAPPPRRRWPRRVALGAVLLAVVVGWGLYLTSVWDRELREAIAEADHADPGWRLMDIEESRPEIKDAENASAQMAKAKQARPARWLIWYQPPNSAGANVVLADPEGFSRSLDERPPPQRLSAEQERVVRSEMERGAVTIAEMRRLIDFPHGRHPIVWKPDYVSSLLPWAQESRDVGNTLRYDVMLRCQDGDLEGAVRTARASFNASCAMRDEPFAVSQLIRSAARAITLRDLERILAQGEPPTEALAEFQRILEEDEKENLFLAAARGERGMIDGFLELVQRGDVTHAQLRQALGAMSLYSAGSSWVGTDVELFALRGTVRAERGEMLRRMNRLVEIAHLPPEERGREMDLWHGGVKEGSTLVRRVLPALVKVEDSTRRSHAEMRCMIALLALERYRRVNHRWPAQLEDLTPLYLERVPLDPLDGRSIKYARREDGVTVYSVGPDGEDDGGKVGEKWLKKGSDWGFRLWDVEKRRQSPPER